MPDDADPSKVTAEFKAGLLKVKVAKDEKTKFATKGTGTKLMVKERRGLPIYFSRVNHDWNERFFVERRWNELRVDFPMG